MYHPAASLNRQPSTLDQPPFAVMGLSSKQLASAKIRVVTRGDIICEPGTPEIVGYVVRGTVKLVTFMPDGRTNIVGVIEAPGFFGRIFGISPEFTIEAATDAVVACFNRRSFEAQLSESRELEHLIHMENLYQLDEAYERITVLACQSMMERLATYMVLRLVATEARSGRSASPVIDVPINRRDFAAYLGTTVETVSRNIQSLVRRGTIGVIDSGNFRLLRRSDLFVIAGQDQEDLLEMARSRAPAQRKKAGFYNAAISTHVVGRDRGGNHDLVAAE